jgi:flavin reductase (DIM6/NTAB) family NADH-FMN oxidoreductase RutF
LSRQPPIVANQRPYHATHRLLKTAQATHDFAQGLEKLADAGKDGSRASEQSLSASNGPTYLKEEVRSIMRKVPAAVVVVTVAHVDPETNKSVPMGIAVSSFSTVTLDPPTVSFNIKQPSKTLSAIRDARGSFRVHLPASDHEGLQIIEHFCKGNRPDAYEERLKNLNVRFYQADGGPKTAAPAPRIMGSGVSAELECVLTHELPVADHVILVAQIKNVRTRDVRAPTIAYVDGSYRRLEGKGLIQRHRSEQDPEQPAAVVRYGASERDLTGSSLPVNFQQEQEIAFDWPGIPGEEERGDFADRVRSYLKGLQGLRFVNQAMVKKRLSLQLEEVAAQLGVNLIALIQECQGRASAAQVLPEFYWRLSASNIATLADRMYQLVKADKRFLEVPYQDLLNYLDVMVGSTDVLPSDLLKTVRAEGLVPPFEPFASLSPADMIDGNVLFMEQAEHLLHHKARTLRRGPQRGQSLRDMADKAGVPTAVMFHFARTRIFTVDPVDLEDTHFEITGDVSPEEGLVVIRRLSEHMMLNYRARTTFETHRHRLREADILRDIHVDPRITGINTSFVMAKIRHLSNNGAPIKRQIDEWLQQFFARTVGSDDLNTRITTFVQRFPLRATSWNNKDVLAAMGLSENTLIVTHDNESSKTIAESKVLNMLLAKALKDHYGNGTDEENKAVAKFLMDKYNFNVTGSKQVSS